VEFNSGEQRLVIGEGDDEGCRGKLAAPVGWIIFLDEPTYLVKILVAKKKKS
jgi:hypothetical protein